MAKQNVVAELFYGGAWHAESVYTRDPITIARGRVDESGQQQPSTLSLILDNRDGSKNPRNPSSPLYGLAGLNTPIRLSLTEATDAFGRTVAGSWGSADTGQAWTNHGVGGTVDASDFEVASGLGKHHVEVDNAYRLTYLGDVSMKDAGVVVTVDMVITDVLTNAVEPANIYFRAQDTSTYYLARVSVSAAEVVTAQLFHSTGGSLGSAETVTGLTFDGSPLTVRAEICGSHLRMRVWAASGDEPEVWHAEATDTTLTAAGWVGIRSGVASGNTNTKPIEFGYDDLRVYDIRFAGEVSSWKPRRTVDFFDASRGDAWVGIDAAGIGLRLGRGNAPSRSPMRHTIGSHVGSGGVIAYWPLEDEADADRAASGISGEPAMKAIGTVEFANIEREITTGGTFRYGTKPYVNLNGGGKLVGRVPLGASSPVAWAVQTGLDTRTDSVSLALVDWIVDSGLYRRFRLQYTQPGNHTRVIGYDVTGAATTLLEWTSSQFAGFVEATVDAVQNGANIDFRLWMGDSLRDSASVAGTLGRIQTVILNPDGQTPESTYNLGFAHCQVWDTNSPQRFYPTFTDAHGATVAHAFFAHWNERADDRLERLCSEAGVTLAAWPAGTHPYPRMGPQPDGTVSDLILEVERVTNGVIHETRDALGLTPRSLESLYNQTVALTLDYSTEGIAPPLEPDIDDLPVVNDFTAKRTGGSSAPYQLLSGALSIQDPPDGVGVYDSDAELNFVDDTRLLDYAAWRVHEGTVEDARYPRVTVDLDAAPSLATAAAAVDIGDVIAVTNLPADDSPDDVRLLVIGIVEVIGSHRRTITFNCAPATAWDVFEVEDANLGRLDSSTSELAEALDTTETGVDVSYTFTGALWSAAGQPFDINIGGERMTVTAVTGSASPQTLTVTRSVNGVVKTHAIGAPVRLWRRGAVAL